MNTLLLYAKQTAAESKSI